MLVSSEKKLFIADIEKCVTYPDMGMKCGEQNLSPLFSADVVV